MGLFSKKTVTCEKCGKSYEVRITLGRHVCEECLAAETERKLNVLGYVEYASFKGWKPYTDEQMEAIAAHRDAILEKYRMTEGISREELAKAGLLYKDLSDEEAASVLVRMGNSSMNSTIGASYTSNFFCPAHYERTVVDIEDIFAVGIGTARGIETNGGEAILCAIFTNDPYLPAFPIVYFGKLGFFEIMKSKKGHQGAAEMFEAMCPNLKYPVQELKKLKKQIKTEGVVNGNIELKAMLDMIDAADGGYDVFSSSVMHSDLPESTTELLDNYGYLEDRQVNVLLRMDKMFNRRYWQKQIKRLTNYDIGE